MAVVEVQCPQCGGRAVVSYGWQANGAQRYRCNTLDCERTIFLPQYQDKGRLPKVKRQIVEMALTGLTLKEFRVVLPAFTRTYTEQYPADRTMTGKPHGSARWVVGAKGCCRSRSSGCYSPWFISKRIPCRPCWVKCLS